MSNNRYTRPFSLTRWILIALSIGLVIGVSIFSIFYFGIFRRANVTGNPTPSTVTGVNNPSGRGGPCFDSPYGFTTIYADSQLVTYFKQLNVCWVRYQIHWRKPQGSKPGIESSPGVYNWSQVDAAIATMNAANIHVDFAIQGAPDWDLTQICSADGKHFLPGPKEMANFATLIATRYDGKHGHGYIDSFEIGNEEYDNYYVSGLGDKQPCRSASYYGPVLKAGYQAIKAANPKALVGMFGLWWHNLPHIKDFITYLYANGYGQYMDYMNFHYYHSGEDPSVTDNDNPSFDLEWQTMHDVAAHYGFGSKPIWVTETGWSGQDPQKQNQYMQYVLNESAKSGVVKKVFWFTINYGHQPDNIYPPSGPLPAFYTLQATVRQKPLWS